MSTTIHISVSRVLFITIFVISGAHTYSGLKRCNVYIFMLCDWMRLIYTGYIQLLSILPVIMCTAGCTKYLVISNPYLLNANNAMIEDGFVYLPIYR